MKNEFKTDTTMIFATAILTFGLFASAVGSMIVNDGTAAAKSESVQLEANAAKVRPVSI